jgi:multiple sugar transport system ATP-binding protein
MIYVTHDQIEALTLADRIAVMHGGIIQQLDVPKTIYHKPANRFVAGFVGSPKMNFLPGRIEMKAGKPVFQGEGVSEPLASYEFLGDVPNGRPVELGIRPEHIQIGGAGGHATGAVSLVEPMGAETIVWADVAGRTLGIRLDGEAQVAPRDTLTLQFPTERLNLFDAESGRRI